MALEHEESKEPNMLTTGQTARRIGLSRQTVKRYIRAGKLPAYQFGERFLVEAGDADQFLQNARVTPEADNECRPRRGRIAPPRPRRSVEGGER